MAVLVAALAVVGVSAAGPIPVGDPSVVEWTGSGVGVAVIRNVGDSTLVLSSETYTAPFFGWTFFATDCVLGAGIPPGGGCSASFFLNSPGAGGQVYSATSNGGGVSIPLVERGTRLVPGVGPGTLDFGTVATGTTSAPQTVTVTNQGDAPLALTTVETARGQFHAVGGTCLGSPPGSIPVGGSCTVQYAFAPTAGGGGATSFFAIGSAGGARYVFVKGTGVTADTTPPTINAPADVHAATSPTDTTGTATVALGTPVASDDRGTVTVTRVPAGDVFPVGTTDVVWTATDGAGNTAVDTQHVTVADATRPVITVAPSVTLVADETCISNDDASVVATLHFFDNVHIVYFARIPGIASAYPLGLTHLTFVVRDANNNEGVASTNITVVDATPPTLTIPPDATVELGGDSSVAALGSATATDNCSTPTIDWTDVSSGHGISRTWHAVDGAGLSTFMVQTITIVDTTDPTISGPADVTVSTGPGNTTGTVVVADGALGTATATDAGGVTVTRSGVPAGNAFPIGTTTVTYTATDGSGNMASAVQHVTVIDNTPPLLTPPPAIGVSTGPGNTTGTVTLGNGQLTASASDNSGGVTVSRSGVPTGNAFPIGTTAVLFTATDAAGNSTSGTTLVVVHDDTAPVLTTPADVTVELGGDTSPASTGTATATDNGGAATVTHNDATTGAVIARTWTATDASGNVATAVQTISVVDTTPPTIDTPSDLDRATGPGNTTGTVLVTDSQLGFPIAHDLSPVTIVRTGVPAGNAFPIGTTTVTYTATDTAGNHASVVQHVLVRDTTPPTVSAPADISVTTGPGSTTSTVIVSALGAAAATDNSGSATLVRTGVPAGNAFPIGTTTVTYTASDAAGNSAVATQRVTVVDNTSPTVTVGSVTAPATSEGGANVTYAVTAADNSGTVAVTCTPVSGSLFAVGTTTVTCTASDPAHNSATATATVTVTQRPALVRLNELDALCWAMGLTPSVAKSGLCPVLDAATANLSRPNIPGTCGNLHAFAVQLDNVRRKNTVTAAQYAALLRAASIGDQLGC